MTEQAEQQYNKIIGSAIKKNRIRFDLEIIAELIKEKSKVLDIGCGNGELLEYLKQVKQIDGRGLEISQTDTSTALKKGISVIQGDAETDLVYYPDNSFDYAILSQTLQTMHKPKEIIRQCLRIAGSAIISFPNFAHFKNRLYLLFKGRMPVSKTIPYQWYNTPNIHFCSIKDFEKLCHKMNYNIESRIYLTNKGKLDDSGNKILANFFAEYGIFVISKNDAASITACETVFKKVADILLPKKTATGLAISLKNKNKQNV